jgi:hypothetical protein
VEEGSAKHTPSPSLTLACQNLDGWVCCEDAGTLLWHLLQHASTRLPPLPSNSWTHAPYLSCPPADPLTSSSKQNSSGLLPFLSRLTSPSLRPSLPPSALAPETQAVVLRQNE